MLLTIAFAQINAFFLVLNVSSASVNSFEFTAKRGKAIVLTAFDHA
jgi:hypothetical protein